MTAIIAYGAIDALGEGEAALASGTVTAVAADPELAAAKLLRPNCARARVEGDGERATLLIGHALDACLRGIDEATLAGKRVGLALGTSSGGLRSLEQRVDLGGTYLGPLLGVPRTMEFEPFSLVLGACASATLAIGIARAWLAEGACDIALAGGFDAVSVFVAAGFEALRATTATVPRPFRIGRDGLALGEGAAILAMVRDEDAPRAMAYVTGFGASCDAVHLTAPDRTGQGLARAATAAWDEAGRPPVGLISAHGTATEYNDAAEAKAITAVLGAATAPVHAFKGAIGHTLGAAGALEALAAVRAMQTGVAPASCGEGELEPGVRVLAAPEPNEARAALKLSSAFGGANAALVLARDRPAPGAHARAVRPVYVSRAVAIDRAPDARALAERTGVAEDKIARGDGLVRLAMGGIAALPGPIAGAGIVVGMSLASLETNCVYLARIKAMGATRAEPRRFPYTTPNAAAGECAVAFGLTGPALAVGGGPHGGIEALMVARDLVATGAADRIVVVSADEVGDATRALAPETREGAVALLVSAEPLAARIDDVTVRLGPAAPRASGAPRALPVPCAPRAMDAHRALLPLCHDRPETISVEQGWGAFANARFFWL